VAELDARQGAARGLGARDDSSVITVVAPEKG